MYTVNNQEVRNVNEQKDLWFEFIVSSLKEATQVDSVVKKAYDLSVFIGWDIEYKCWDVVLCTWKIMCSSDHHYIGESTEEINKMAVWIGDLQLYGD